MNLQHHIGRPFSVSLFALFAVLIFCGHLRGQQTLDDFEFKYQKVTAEIASLKLDMARQSKANSFGGGEGVRSEEEREKLRVLEKDQLFFLDKMISLSPDNKAYRFDLAKVVAGQGDQARALNILNELAPEDRTGYAPAHFVLASQYFNRPAVADDELSASLGFALKHVDHCLSVDEADAQAKLLKARILTRMQQYEDAYLLYEELIEVNPNYYREMLKLNKLLGQQERDQPLCEKALASFQQLGGKEEHQSDDRRWIVIEAGIAKTLQKLSRFAEAESRINDQIATYAADPKGGPRRVFLQRINADNYIAWAGSIADARKSYDSLPPKTLAVLLDLSTKAYRNHEDNVLALQNLTRLSQTSNVEIASQAKAVYDPEADVDAPSAVLNQLGNTALLNKNFTDAIRFYERARQKSPKDAAVLNNLAFSYLVAEDGDRNPERALSLINEAIRNLPGNVAPVERSKFLHTKATALKQLNRLEEALGIFEKALKSRPRHIDTLRSLIECYRGLGMEPPELYASTLAEVEE